MHKIEDNMKKTYAVLAGVALIAALASCDRKAEYKTYPFATLEATSYAIAENSGVLRIPVSVFDNDGGSGSVTFVVKDGTAKEGADFTVSPSNGVLSFTGNGTQYIEIAVVDHKGVFTGNTNCSVSAPLNSSKRSDPSNITAGSRSPIAHMSPVSSIYILKALLSS